MGTPIQGTTYGKSWVDVCNWALRRIGCKRITSLTDGSKEQLACSDLLGDAITNVVSANDDWACLRARVQLAVDASYVPPTDFLYAYAMPNDFERWVDIETYIDASAVPPAGVWNEPPVQQMPWSREQNWILSNSTVVYLRYGRTVNNEDAGLMPKSFVCAVQTALAVALLVPLRQNVGLLPHLEKQAADALKDAIATDDQSKQTWEGSRKRGYRYYEEARYGGTWPPNPGDWW